MARHDDSNDTPMKCSYHPDGVHVPEPDTARPADGASFVFDFWCLCGVSGSACIDPNDINFD